MEAGTKTKSQLHAEAVEKVRGGGRITNEHSLFVVEQDRPCGAHHWRTLLCDSETDVCECRTTLVTEATDYVKAMQWGDRLVNLDEEKANLVYGKYMSKLDPSNDKAPWDNDPTKSDAY